MLADYGTPLQAERKDDGLNIGKAGSLDIAEMIATIRAGGGGWEDNVTKLVGKLIREGLDIDMIVALLREQITLKDQKNVRTGKFWTEKNTEWSLRKIYKSLKAKEAREAEEPSAEPEPEHTEEPKPSDKAQKPPITLPINLPAEFWEARPRFRQLRDYAWYNRLSPDALLGVCLARTAAFVAAGTMLYSKPDGCVPNLFSATVGNPGAGKTGVPKIARRIVPQPPVPLDAPEPVDGNTIGSGEGLLQAYLKWNIKEHALEQVTFNAYVVADEGPIIKSIEDRTGSSLGPILCTIFTGEPTGTLNASKGAQRHISDYHLGLAINLTPEATKHILSKDKYGTPQRFLWNSATDASMPLNVPATECPVINLPTEVRHITFAAPILAEIDKALHARVTGREEVALLDAHVSWIQCKVAALFALWEDRSTVSKKDWRLAAMVVKASCAVRDNILAQLKKQADGKGRAACRACCRQHHPQDRFDTSGNICQALSQVRYR